MEGMLYLYPASQLSLSLLYLYPASQFFLNIPIPASASLYSPELRLGLGWQIIGSVKIDQNLQPKINIDTE